MKIILDCDPGIDDALAIILGIKSKQIQINRISTVNGNSSVEQSSLNVRRLLDYLKIEIPVAEGESKPLKYERLKGLNFHGNDGLGDLDILNKTTKQLYKKSIKEFYEEALKQNTKTIVATGPLTNIAKLTKEHSEIINSFEKIIIMGGTINESGNIDKKSEFNFYADPHAADYVLNNLKIPIILVPLDATRQIKVTPDMIKNTSNLVKSLLEAYIQKYQGRGGFEGCFLHDPLALGYAINPSLMKTYPMNLVVETEGKYTRGVCIPELRPWANKKPNVNVVMEVDSIKFLENFFKIM